MKHLFLTLLLVLWGLPQAGAGEAILDPLPHCYGQPGLIRVPCGEHELHFLLERKRCAEKMEAAMRTMEPFLLHNFMFVPEDNQLRAPLGAYGPAIRASKERAKLWDAAKKECWGQEPTP